MGFAEHFREVRESKGMSLYTLAQRAGLSKQGAINLELPDADPRLSTLYKAANALGVEVEELIARPNTIDAKGEQAKSVMSKGTLRNKAGELPKLLADFLAESKKHHVERSDAAMAGVASVIRKVITHKKSTPHYSAVVMARMRAELLPLLDKYMREGKRHRVERSDKPMQAVADCIASLVN